ncbi:MAG: hypothetical protein V4543_02710 [Bacteroidota bacterium]
MKETEEENYSRFSLPKAGSLPNDRLPALGLLRLVAKVISIVFHPLAMPTYTFAILFFLAQNFSMLDPDQNLKILGFIAILTGVLPAVLSAMFFIREGESLSMEDRSRRVYPFLLTAFIYVCIAYLFRVLLQSHYNMQLLMNCIACSALLSAIITLRWKISTHAMGAAGMTGALAATLIIMGDERIFVPLTLSIVLWGLVCSSRLLLNAHTTAQIVAGSIAGCGITFGLLFLYL